MSSKLPYMLTVGSIPRIFESIQNARRPDRFTQDFLETKLGHRGGSQKPIIPLLKRMGFLASDGTPTELYDQFRNTNTSGLAIAKGMKTAFHEIFERNEYADQLTQDKLLQLIIEITGGTKEDRRVQAISATFTTLKKLADFDETLSSEIDTSITENASPLVTSKHPDSTSDNVDLRISYTINLNLPESSNPDVFYAIFKALRENLLKNQ